LNPRRLKPGDQNSVWPGNRNGDWEIQRRF
jgi:hypothetical protein